MVAIPYLQLCVLVMVGLLAGAHLIGVVGLNPALRSLPAGGYVPMKQALDQSMPRLAKPLTLGALIGSAALTGLALATGESRIGLLSAGSTAAMLVVLAAVIRGDVPINRRMATWSADDPPADWRRSVLTWERYFAVRTVAVSISFACAAVGALQR